MLAYKRYVTVKDTGNLMLTGLPFKSGQRRTFRRQRAFLRIRFPRRLEPIGLQSEGYYPLEMRKGLKSKRRWKISIDF